MEIKFFEKKKGLRNKIVERRKLSSRIFIFMLLSYENSATYEHF